MFRKVEHPVQFPEENRNKSLSSQNDIELPSFNVRQNSKEKKSKQNEDEKESCARRELRGRGSKETAALITGNEAVSLYAHQKIIM